MYQGNDVVGSEISCTSSEASLRLDLPWCKLMYQFEGKGLRVLVCMYAPSGEICTYNLGSLGEEAVM